MDSSVKIAGQAIKTNIKPGVLLWSLLVLFGIGYATVPSFNQSLAQLAEIKVKWGHIFSFIIYSFAAALFPEVLKIFFFQKAKVTKENVRNALFGIILFGFAGIVSDIFFSTVQVWLYGTGTDIATILKKTATDQFSFSPLICTVVLLFLMWKENGFRVNTKQEFSLPLFFREKLIPLYVAMWLVWIPGVALVYFMPTALQLPVSSFVLCFWTLIISFMSLKKTPNKNNY
jgi:hypothetical protein